MFSSHGRSAPLPHNPHAKYRPNRGGHCNCLPRSSPDDLSRSTADRCVDLDPWNLYLHKTDLSLNDWISGFLVDKMGNYKPVVILSLVLNLIFHHSLLFIPHQEMPGMMPAAYVVRHPATGKVEVMHNVQWTCYENIRTTQNTCSYDSNEIVINSAITIYEFQQFLQSSYTETEND